MVVYLNDNLTKISCKWSPIDLFLKLKQDKLVCAVSVAFLDIFICYNDGHDVNLSFVGKCLVHILSLVEPMDSPSLVGSLVKILRGL